MNPTTRLGRIGFDHVAGYLQDGLHSLESRPDLIAFTERLSAPFAAELLVFQPSRRWPSTFARPREREQKYIAGSLSIPLNHLEENLEKLPKDRPLLVYCAGGYRSSIAASLLQRGGFASRRRNRRRHRGMGSRKTAGANRPASPLIRLQIRAPAKLSVLG